MEKFENKVVVPIISPSGEVLEQQGRTMRNVPYPELFPPAAPVIIDWLSTGKTPTLIDVKQWVKFAGRKYCGAWAWGSAVKRGQSIGLTRDWLVEIGLLKHAERSIKSGRYLMGQGLYGALKGKMKVRVVKAGTMVGDYPVEDGHSLIRRSLAKQGHEGYGTISLSFSRQSDTHWQWIPWTEELRREMQPFINSTLIDVGEGRYWKYAQGPHIDERRKLIDVDESMEYHPYCAFTFTRGASDTFARICTTVQIPTLSKVAVPTTAPKAALWGKYSLTRYPEDSPGSTQAVTCRASKAERERIAKMEVVQYTIATKSMMANGCFAVVDDDLMPDGIDIVLCQDDIKMGSIAQGKREITGILTFNQWYQAGASLGINAKWAKKRMGADFDGDIIYVANLDKLPVLYAAILNRPYGETAKLEKTKSGLDHRPQMLVDSMKNLVGFASNVARLTFVMADRLRTAQLLGFADEKALNDRLTWFIKVGTDGFKTRPQLNGKTVTLKEVEAMLSDMQRNLGMFTSGCPWAKWPNEWAWSRLTPRWAEEGEDRDEYGLVIPSYYDGTIAQLIRLTLPALAAQNRSSIKMYPLSRYANWAPRVPAALAKQAHMLQMEFNARVGAVNFTWGDQVLYFKTWWQERLSGWIQEAGQSRLLCAYTLWREAHSARSQNASAASVFIGFPDESEHIIRDKPGKTAAEETMLLGLEYVFESVPSVIDAEVSVVEFAQRRGDREVLRKLVLVEEYPGKKAPRKPYPKDLLGMVELTSLQPEDGTYLAHIVKAGRGKAWHVQLRSI